MELQNKLPGIEGVPVVVGHSNGGILARERSKTKPMKGLLTLSSPNQGAPIANNAIAWGMYNGSIVAGLMNVQASFSNPNEGSYWILSVIQGALAFAADTVGTGVAALGAAGFDIAAPVFSQDKVGSSYMQSLNSGGNLAREAAAIPHRVSIASYVPDYNLGGAFRALSPDNVDYFRAALWAAVGTLDVWAGTIASSGVPRDIERAQRMLTASFLLSLHEVMWCQAVSDPTPYAVTFGGACHPNDTFIPTWSHVLPGSLVIPKPNMPAHIQQTERMIPVLYEVLTTHMGVAPRAPGGGPGTPSILPGGSQLTPGQQISSPDGRYRLDLPDRRQSRDLSRRWPARVVDGNGRHLAQRHQDAVGRKLRRLRHRELPALAHPHVREPWRLPFDAEQRRLRDQLPPVARGSGAAPFPPTR